MKKILSLLICLNFLTSAQKINPFFKICNQNLIKNPNAETTTEESGTPFWGNNDTLLSEQYGHTAGEFESDWGTKRGFGGNYFRFSGAARTDIRKTRMQEIDLLPVTDSIKAKHLNYYLCGFFGTFRSQDFGAVTLHAVFIDRSGKEVLHVQTEAVMPSDIKSGDWEMIKKESRGVIPAEAVSLKIFMSATGIKENSGQNNSTWASFADNLSLMLMPMGRR
jgi:hypothetical protein